MSLNPAKASFEQTVGGLPCSVVMKLKFEYASGCYPESDIFSDEAFLDTLDFLGATYDSLKEQEMHLALAKRCSIDATTPGEITFTGFVEWYRRTYQQIHAEPEAQSDPADKEPEVHTKDHYGFTKVDNSWAEVPLLRLSSDPGASGGSKHEAHGNKVVA